MFQFSHQVTLSSLLFDLEWLLMGYIEDKGIISIIPVKISK